MILRCEAPGCMNEAKGRNKFLDPRRSTAKDKQYVLRHYCCDEHALFIMETLEFQSQYLHLAS